MSVETDKSSYSAGRHMCRWLIEHRASVARSGFFREVGCDHRLEFLQEASTTGLSDHRPAREKTVLTVLGRQRPSEVRSEGVSGCMTAPAAHSDGIGRGVLVQAKGL